MHLLKLKQTKEEGSETQKYSSTCPDALLVSPSNLFNLSFTKLLSHLTSHVFLCCYTFTAQIASVKVQKQMNEMKWNKKWKEKLERNVRELSMRRLTLIKLSFVCSFSSAYHSAAPWVIIFFYYILRFFVLLHILDINHIQFIYSLTCVKTFWY